MKTITLGICILLLSAQISLSLHAQEIYQINGRIAFVSDRDGFTEIYSMSYDGTDVRRLTINESHDRYPSWSPDGTQIAFSSNRNGSVSDIYIMDADGSNQVNLTTNSDSNDRYPSWSPDGTQIAFSRSIGGISEIFIINVDGSGLVKIADSTEQSYNLMPTWSPDGKEIMFTSTNELPTVGFGAFNIEKVNVDGSSRTRIGRVLNTYGNLDWSWSNNTITYYDADINTEIFTMDSVASNVNLVTLTPSEINMSHQHPAWSPDGTKILYEGQIFSEPTIDSDADIYILDLRTGKNINITDNFDSNDMMPDWQPLARQCYVTAPVEEVKRTNIDSETTKFCTDENN